MTTLLVSQTVFYIVSSIAIVILGVLLCYAAYQLIRILKNTRDVAEDISFIYKKARGRIKKFLGGK